MSKILSNLNEETVSSLLFLHLKKREIGRVHSCFSSSLNIEIGDLLLNLTTTEKQLGPWGICIAPDKFQRILDNSNLETLVRYDKQLLVFFTSRERMTINLAALKDKNLQLQSIESSDLIDSSILLQELSKIDFDERIGIGKSFDFQRNCQRLISNLEDFDYQELIHYFIGRGKGLTPSGDDLLLGFSSVHLYFNPNSQWMTHLMTHYKNGLTTRISDSFFQALFAGAVSENIRRVLLLSNSSSRKKVQLAIKELRKLGHTSGIDTLYGIFLGLLSVKNQQDVNVKKLNNKIREVQNGS